MIKPSVLLIRLSALVCRSLSGILNRQAADNHQNFVQTIAGSRVDQDTSELGVDWQARHRATNFGESLFGINRR